MPLDPRISLGVMNPLEATAQAQTNALDAQRLRAAPLEMRAKELEMKRLEADNVQREARQAFEYLSTAKDENTYQMMRRRAQQSGVDISDLPEVYDANFVEFAKGAALTAAERMEQQKQQLGGIQSKGFEGDMARSLYDRLRAQGVDELTAREQAIGSVAQRLKGGFDPVTGNWSLNQAASIPTMATLGGTAAVGPTNPVAAPEGAPMPLVQGGEGGLLPPPADLPTGQQRMPASTFGAPNPMASPVGVTFTPTGNRKTDAALQQKALELQMEQSAKSQEGQNERARDLPTAVDNAIRALDNIDALLNDKDLGSISGGMFGLEGQLAQRLPLTEAQRRLQPRVDSLRGETFLQAYQTLKGGGQITEVEGKKAEAAIARINAQYTPDEDYRLALKDLRDIIQKGVERAKNSATMTAAEIRDNAAAKADDVLNSTGNKDFSRMSDDELKRMLGL